MPSSCVDTASEREPAATVNLGSVIWQVVLRDESRTTFRVGSNFGGFSSNFEVYLTVSVFYNSSACICGLNSQNIDLSYEHTGNLF